MAPTARTVADALADGDLNRCCCHWGTARGGVRCNCCGRDGRPRTASDRPSRFCPRGGQAQARRHRCRQGREAAGEVADQGMAWFVRRRQLEVMFAEVRRHLGVATQRQWSELAVRRTTPALLGLFSVVTLLAHGPLTAPAARGGRRSGWPEAWAVATAVGVSAVLVRDQSSDQSERPAAASGASGGFPASPQPENRNVRQGGKHSATNQARCPCGHGWAMKMRHPQRVAARSTSMRPRCREPEHQADRGAPRIG
jgi:hypothetical protein